MIDQRINKLASLLINYSLDVQPKHQMVLQWTQESEPLMLACYEEAIKAGANISYLPFLPEADEIFYKYANDDQLEYISPVRRLIFETFDARLAIGGDRNTRILSNVDPARQARTSKAHAPLTKIFFDRAAHKEVRWCYTEYPTNGGAQEADMSLRDYAEFIFQAGKLNEPDPVASWRAEGQRQRQLAAWLSGRDQVWVKGADIDLKFSIKGRTFEISDGRYNFPDGEIFTGPVEHSVNGYVRFNYPAIFNGREVVDVELWFEDGKVIKERASKNQDFLTALLDTDSGSRYIGEWGIGTNYAITRFTKNMLFDEKIGGTIHFALGASYPETGGVNDSGLHWDMLCDMSQSEISVDGDLFYQDGKPVV